MADIEADTNNNDGTSVIELIQTRLAGLSAQQVAVPTDDAPSSEGATILGVANGRMRRLFCLANIFGDEKKALQTELKQLELKETAGHSLNADEQERLSELRRETYMKVMLQTITRTMFACELWLNIPRASEQSGVIIYSDWSIGTLPPMQSIRIISIGDLPDDLPPEIADMLRGFGGMRR